jgi:hypothetical protein
MFGSLQGAFERSITRDTHKSTATISNRKAIVARPAKLGTNEQTKSFPSSPSRIVATRAFDRPVDFRTVPTPVAIDSPISSTGFHSFS